MDCLWTPAASTLLSTVYMIVAMLAHSLHGESPADFRLGAMKSKGQVGDTFRFFIRYTRPLKKLDFYVRVYKNLETSVFDHCLSTIIDHERYPVRFRNGQETTLDAPDHFHFVRTFEFSFNVQGRYTVAVQEVKEHLHGYLGMNRSSFVGKLTIQVVLSPVFNLPPNSTENPLFRVNNQELSSVLMMTTYTMDISDWAVVKTKGPKVLKNATYKWDIHKVAQQPAVDLNIPPLCINFKRLGQVNLTALYVAHLPLQVSMKDPELTIQPYTLPPGLFRICLMVSKKGVALKSCGYLVRDAVDKDLSFLIHIVLLPYEDLLTAPVKDSLTLDATSSRLDFFTSGSGVTNELDYYLRWECSGHIDTCVAIAVNMFPDYEYAMNETIVLPTSEYILGIEAGWLVVTGQVITISLTFGFFERLTGFYGIDTVYKTITLTDGTGIMWVPYLHIRCLLNCWYYQSRDFKLLLGISCFGCAEYERKFIRIQWQTVSDLSGTLYNNKVESFYYTVDMKTFTDEEFYIEAKFIYEPLNGDPVETISRKTFQLFPVIELEVLYHIKKEVLGGVLDRRFWQLHFQLEFLTKSESPEVYPLIITVEAIDKWENISFLLTRTYSSLFYLVLDKTKSYDLNINVSAANGALFSKTLITSDTIAALPLKDVPDGGGEEQMIHLRVFPAKDESELMLLSNSPDKREFLQFLEPLSSVIQSSMRDRQAKNEEMMINIIQTLIKYHQEIVHPGSLHVVLVVVKRFMADSLLKRAEILYSAMSFLENMNKDVLLIETDDYINTMKTIRTMLEIINRISHLLLDDPGVNMRTAKFSESKVYIKTIDLIWKMLLYAAFKLPESFPRVETFSNDLFESKIFWFDSSNQDYVMTVFGVAKITFVSSNLEDTLNVLTTDTHFGVGILLKGRQIAYVSYQGLPLNVPIMYLSIAQGEDNNFPMRDTESVKMDVLLKYDQTALQLDTLMFAFNLTLSEESAPVSVIDSDCLLLQVEPSSLYATGVQITSRSGLQLGVVVRSAVTYSELMDMMEDGPVKMPLKSEIDMGVTKNPNIIFLPTIRQGPAHDHSNFKYILLVTVTRAQQVDNVSLSRFVNGTDEIYVTCYRAVCVDQAHAYFSWTHADCVPGRFTAGSPSYLHCRCQIVRRLTGGVTNCSSDMSVPWKHFDVENPDVYLNFDICLFVLGLWWVYLATVMWTRKRDKMENPLGRTQVLPELFNPYQTQQYLLCVVTGWGKGSGTTSIPHVILVGSKKISNKYKLCVSKCSYQTGSAIWFLISGKEDLGNIESVILSLEVRGKKRNWFVSHLFLRNITTNEDLYCVCDSWILDGSHEKTFIVKPFTHEAGTRQRIVIGNFIHLMRSLHVIIGTVYNVPGSHFSKTGHAACLLSSILIIMCACLQIMDWPRAHVAGDDYRSLRSVHAKRDQVIISDVLISVILSTLPSLVLSVLFSVSQQESRSLEWPLKTRFLEEDDYASMLLSLPMIELSPLDISVNPVTQRKNTVAGRDSIWHRSDSLSAITPSLTAHKASSPCIQQNDSPMALLALKAMHEEGVYLGSPVVIGSAIDPESVVHPYYMKKRRRQTQCYMALKSNLKFGETSYSYKNLKTLASYLSPPVSVLHVVHAFLLVSATYALVVIGFMFTHEQCKYFLTVSAITTVTVLLICHPTIVFVSAVILSKRWPLYRNEADKRLEKRDKEMPGCIKMLALGIFQMQGSTTKKSHIYSKDYIRYTRGRSAETLVKLDMFKTKVTKKSQSRGRTEIIIFIVLVMLIIHLDSGSVQNRYQQSKFLKRLLKIAEYQEAITTVMTADDVWHHLRRYFHDCVYWKLRTRNTTMSYVSLSQVRVRQVRVQPEKDVCPWNFIKNTTKPCRKDIEMAEQEFRNFSYEWDLMTQRDAGQGPFTYVYGRTTRTSRHAYPNGGYDAMFSIDSLEPDVIDDLQARKWVDEQTRALIVDMAVFNPDSELMTTIIHVYEFTSLGIIQETLFVFTFSLFLKSQASIWQGVCIAILAVFNLYCLTMDITCIYHMGLKEYWKSKDSWLNMLEIVICFAIVAGVIINGFVTQETVGMVQRAYFKRGTQGQHVNFLYVSNMALMLTLLCSILTLFCLIRIIQLLRKMTQFKVFLKILPEIFKIAFLPFLAIISFAVIGTACFGHDMADFSSFDRSLKTMTVFLFDQKVLGALVESHPNLGSLYMCTCLTILLFVIVNNFIVVINEFYTQAKRMLCIRQKLFRSAWQRTINVKAFSNKPEH